MTASVVTPFRASGCDWRTRARAWVRGHYLEHHPSWELLEGTVGDGEWSKGAAVADAVARSTGDVLVIADADSFVDPAVLAHAAARATETGWVVPHRHVVRLHSRATEGVYAGATPRHGHWVRPPYTGPAGGGIVVITRSAYLEVRGIDDRFLGWGGEDVSFGWALETLVGPAVRLDGVLWHLWHPHPAPKLRGSPESEALVARYKAARHIPRLMRAVVDRCDPEPVAQLAEPARFRSTRPNRKVRTALGVVKFVDHRFETTDADLADALHLADGVELEEVSPCAPTGS